VTADAKAHTKTFHWRQDIPHASYLIALAAGPYVVLHDKAGSVPLEYWVYPGQEADARASFAKTADMVQWFSSKIGYPYAWEKYAQVLIRDFIEGGMENSSCTFLTDNGSVYDARERIDRSPNSLIAHELAHQWWGDVVTARDWRHLWLNESFASYFDPLWHEHDLGREEFDYQMYRAQEDGINSDKHAGRKPIVSVGSYGANLYPRGASVLHMLRFVLGDSLFWRSLNRYIVVHQHTPVETNDLIRRIQDATGQNLTWFFDQWVYKAGYPIFDLTSAWSDSARTLALTVRQVQTQDSLTGIFRTPAEIELTLPEGKTLVTVTLASADTTIRIPSASRPTAVVFDPANWLLKEVHWSKPAAEWEYLAGHAGNPVERIRALQAIAGLPGGVRSLPVVAAIAHSDDFWAVRREALVTISKFDSLSSSDSSRVIQAFIDASRDAKPSVRSLSISNLGKFRGGPVREAVRAALLDSSISAASAALRSLAKVDSANAAAPLLARLKDAHEYPAIAGAALSALAGVDTSAAYAYALGHAGRGTEGEIRWPAINLLARFGRERKDARAVFVRMINEPRSWYRSWAIRKLGDIGTAEELEGLSAVASQVTDPDSKTAGESIDRIKKRIEGGSKEEH
jgi:aminopeptidase N